MAICGAFILCLCGGFGGILFLEITQNMYYCVEHTVAPGLHSFMQLVLYLFGFCDSPTNTSVGHVYLGQETP